MYKLAWSCIVIFIAGHIIHSSDAVKNDELAAALDPVTGRYYRANQAALLRLYEEYPVLDLQSGTSDPWRLTRCQAIAQVFLNAGYAAEYGAYLSARTNDVLPPPAISNTQLKFTVSAGDRDIISRTFPSFTDAVKDTEFASALVTTVLDAYHSDSLVCKVRQTDCYSLIRLEGLIWMDVQKRIVDIHEALEQLLHRFATTGGTEIYEVDIWSDVVTATDELLKDL